MLFKNLTKEYFYASVFNNTGRRLNMTTKTLDELNKKNPFVQRAEILKDYGSVIISRTEDETICFDIPKGDDILALALKRESSLINSYTRTVRVDSYCDHAPEGLTTEVCINRKKVDYDMQFSINGTHTPKRHCSTNITFSNKGFEGPIERNLLEGICHDEHRAIAMQLGDPLRDMWDEFIPDSNKMKRLEESARRQDNDNGFAQLLKSFMSKCNS